MTEKVLSIQSQVAYGHVGNSAATLPLQRLGFDVMAIPSVILGNHKGYGEWSGFEPTQTQLRGLLHCIEARNALATTRAVLTGYLSDPAVGAVVLDAVAATRRARSDAVYLCDPVAGDTDSGFFVPPEIRAFLRDEAIAHADIITPNSFELAWLADMPVTSVDEAIEASRRAIERGPSIVVTTSIESGEQPGMIGVLAVSRHQRLIVWTERLPTKLNGTGDAFAALFLGHFLREGDIRAALELAASGMAHLVAITARAGTREPQIVAAQDELVAPSRRYRADSLDC